MQIRKEKLECENYYHIFTRSIAKFVVFNNPQEYSRMINILKLYRHINFNYCYSKFVKLGLKTQKTIINNLEKEKSYFVEIIAYCLMPTHIHLILMQTQDHGISKYMAKILNCYSKFFNIKHGRIGPLWSGRFKSVLVSNDDQLLHLTRYVHLNPTSASLVKKPDQWPYSSYKEYIGLNFKSGLIKISKNLFDFTPAEYRKFVMNRKSYQQELAKIKSLLIDNYTG